MEKRTRDVDARITDFCALELRGPKNNAHSRAVVFTITARAFRDGISLEGIFLVGWILDSLDIYVRHQSWKKFISFYGQIMVNVMVKNYKLWYISLSS